ncbi:MAG: hypothetical protein WC461_01355 [Candidatus Paceibacterota bacterium]
MKKALIISIISVLLIPFFAFAITPGTIPESKDYGINSSGLPTDTSDLLDILSSIVNVVYIVFFVVAVLFVIFAAFNYLTGANAPEKIKSAHTQLIYAAVAIAVALLAVSFQFIIGNFLKGSDQSNSANQSYNGSLEYIPGDFR